MDSFDAKYHSLIRTTLHEQLSHTPEKETLNRKPLRQPAPLEATWELRFGPQNSFRAFYEVDAEEKIVSILGLGIKQGNKLLIAGKEYEP